MKPVGLVGFLLFSLLPFVGSTQQSNSASSLTGDPAVDVWVRATFGQEVDSHALDTLPSAVDRTRFLVSLNETERLGAFRFRQRCNVCHAPTMSAPETTYAPRLTKNTVE